MGAAGADPLTSDSDQQIPGEGDGMGSDFQRNEVGK